MEFWSGMAALVFFLVGVITGLLPCTLYLLVERFCDRETGSQSATEPNKAELVRTVRDAVAIELREWRA